MTHQEIPFRVPYNYFFRCTKCERIFGRFKKPQKGEQPRNCRCGSFLKSWKIGKLYQGNWDRVLVFAEMKSGSDLHNSCASQIGYRLYYVTCVNADNNSLCERFTKQSSQNVLQRKWNRLRSHLKYRKVLVSISVRLSIFQPFFACTCPPNFPLVGWIWVWVDLDLSAFGFNGYSFTRM